MSAPSTAPAAAPSAGTPGLVPQGPVRAQFDGSPDPVWSVDSAGVCHYANPATAVLFGRPVTDLVGARLHPLLHVPSAVPAVPDGW